MKVHDIAVNFSDEAKSNHFYVIFLKDHDCFGCVDEIFLTYDEACEFIRSFCDEEEVYLFPVKKFLKAF